MTQFREIVENALFNYRVLTLIKECSGYKLENVVNFSRNGNVEPCGSYLTKGYEIHDIMLNRNAFEHNSNCGFFLAEGVQDSEFQWGLNNYAGGMIVFSTNVNSVLNDKSSIVKKLKSIYYTTINNLMKNKKLANIYKRWNAEYGDKEYLGGYTFGHGFKGRYQGENGEIFDESSITLEFAGMSSEFLLLFATEVCKEFKQETALVKDYNNGKIYYANGKDVDGVNPDEVYSNASVELQKTKNLNKKVFKGNGAI